MPGTGFTGARHQRADVGANVDRAGEIVAEVAQQPPAARRPAGAVVEREHERVVADPDAPEGLGQLAGLGQRVAATSRVADLAGQVVLGIEVDGAGDVPGQVVVPRTAVDEERRSSQGAPWRDAQLEHLVMRERGRELGGAGGRVVGPDDHGRPRPGQGRARAPAGRSARTASSTSDGR